MEATIASFEEQLAIAVQEKENLQTNNDKLALDLVTMSEKLQTCNYESTTLEEEVSCLVRMFSLLCGLCTYDSFLQA